MSAASQIDSGFVQMFFSAAVRIHISNSVKELCEAGTLSQYSVLDIPTHRFTQKLCAFARCLCANVLPTLRRNGYAAAGAFLASALAEVAATDAREMLPLPIPTKLDKPLFGPTESHVRSRDDLPLVEGRDVHSGRGGGDMRTAV